MSASRSLPRIAIVSMGGVFPAPGSTPSALWQTARAGRDALRTVPPGRWPLDPRLAHAPGGPHPDRVSSLVGCFVEPFFPDLNGLDLPEGLVRQLDPLFHLVLEAGRQAFASARTGTLDLARVGVILGNIALPTERASALARAYLGRGFVEQVLGGSVSVPDGQARPTDGHVAGLPAGLLARALGLGGKAFTLDAACASSLYAIRLAAAELQAGRADAMLAGGASRPDSLYTQMGFSQLRALSPSGRSAPFDRRGDGLVVGEGAGVFVLKRLDDAVRDGDRIWAVLAGAGLSNDVGGGLLAPSSEGQLRAMRQAYHEAGWHPHDVDLIECHATGTPVGDRVEYESLCRLWGEAGWQAGQCVLGSVKATVGHLLTGAGAAGLVKVLHALAEGVLPPLASFESPAPGIDLDRGPFRILREAAPWPRRRGGVPRRAAISGFGFGGINAHLLLEEYLPDSARPAAPVTDVTPIAVIAVDARLGPWTSLPATQRRLLGGDAEAAPQPPPHWGSLGAAAPAGRFPGFYRSSISVSLERFRIPPRELEEMLPQQLLMLDVAVSLLEGRPVGDPARLRTGVYVGLELDPGTTNFTFRWSLLEAARAWAGDLGLSEEEADAWAGRLREAAGPALSANRVMGSLGSIVASRIARELRLGGPSFTLAAEEASGLRALDQAVRALQRGDLDLAMVGAVDLAGDVRSVLAGQAQRPSATAGSRPFDEHSDGVLHGEGAAGVLLKRLEDARRDGDPVLAVLRGIGTASGGEPLRAGPDLSAFRLALGRACAEAGLAAGDLDHLETQASGHPDEDRREALALAYVLEGRHDRPLSLGSIKPDAGHTGAAAGLASLVRACLVLDREILPPLPVPQQPLAELAAHAGQAVLPRSPRYWLHDRAAGPRRAAVSCAALDGSCTVVVLEGEADPTPRGEPLRARPLGPPREVLLVCEADSVAGLRARLDEMDRLARASDGISLAALARRWHLLHPARPPLPLALALVVDGPAALPRQLEGARAILDDPRAVLPPALRDRIFFSPRPLGPDAPVALVFPGSGSDFPGMGSELALAWPEVLRRQQAENDLLRSQYVADAFWHGAPGEIPHCERIQAQVALGTLVTDLLGLFGVRPRAALGYSLGESAALFALRAWTDRDGMLRRLLASPLFRSDLVGTYDAARRAWGLPAGAPVRWLAGIVAAPPEEVRAALVGEARAYLLLVNTPRECVVGGAEDAVGRVAARLGVPLVPVRDPSSVHCPVLREVAEAYRALHLLPTAPPAGVRFYSGALGHAYELTSDSAAEAILAQALDTVSFPTVVETAHADGARIFVEVGPGASCTRMVSAILAGREHRARSACVAGTSEVSSVLRLLALLVSERVPVRLDLLYPDEPAAAAGGHTVTVPVGLRPFGSAPVPVRSAPAPVPQVTGPAPVSAAPLAAAREAGHLVRETVAAWQARGEAHQAFLRFSSALGEDTRGVLLLQQQMLEVLALRAPAGRLPDLSGGTAAPRDAGLSFPPRSLDRGQCLEYAVGSIAAVLGPDYAPVDAFPTRVRLPDEPLMLVDRIVHIEGEPLSLTHGRVVTEHDVLAGGWYLDGGRVPTCIAVEAGQADLFLSGFLGIDLHTRGLAVYRLLDAVVTFHRELPVPGEVIRYDIHIDRFFRQGETYLFRFRFEGTVAGQPLLTMRDGCAGFFSAEELAAGRGVVQTALDRRPLPGVEPDDQDELPSLGGPEAYTAGQVDALRRGDLEGAFGADFAGLTLAPGLRLPDGAMRLVHRVGVLEPRGGRSGIGLIRGEADIHPDDWFLTCHFVDDQVMPGTLMYECCLHTLRVFLLRLGWVAGGDAAVRCEPVPGVASQLKCRGQVTASTRTVTYEVVLRERGYRPEPYVICDALMYADGKPIVEITGMSLRVVGLSRAEIADVWRGRRATPAAAPAPAIFDRDRILAFAIGKPSEAFGEPYRIFDRERVIARLPGPPYQFLDRIVDIEAAPWCMEPGGRIVAEYDVPPDAWYFDAAGQEVMPFAVLLEVALQPCGWMAAYMGSALTSPVDLSFRNLDGEAVLREPVTRGHGTLRTQVEVERVATSGGMIIQKYRFLVSCVGREVYRGGTTFGFFSREALAQQVGIRDARPYEPSPEELGQARAFPCPGQRDRAGMPDGRWAMLDRVDAYLPAGGPAGLGLLRGSKTVDPEAWFFRAHFHQDPVWPGSLGLEALLQLLQVASLERWPARGEPRFLPMLGEHAWTYRGQVIPASRHVGVQAEVTACDEGQRQLTADGWLSVDGRVIYRMKRFTLRREPDAS